MREGSAAWSANRDPQDLLGPLDSWDPRDHPVSRDLPDLEEKEARSDPMEHQAATGHEVHRALKVLRGFRANQETRDLMGTRATPV